MRASTYTKRIPGRNKSKQNEKEEEYDEEHSTNRVAKQEGAKHKQLGVDDRESRDNSIALIKRR